VKDKGRAKMRHVAQQKGVSEDYCGVPKPKSQRLEQEMTPKLQKAKSHRKKQEKKKGKKGTPAPAQPKEREPVHPLSVGFRFYMLKTLGRSKIMTHNVTGRGSQGERRKTKLPSEDLKKLEEIQGINYI